MMGAGKSAVGRALSKRLSLPFVDSDAEIVSRAGCSIPEIFERDGEVVFRTLEAEVIRDIAKKSQVVALGGGAAAQPGMVDLLRERGTMIYLRAATETLFDRIGPAHSRPMLRDLSPGERAERLETLLREREPSYSQAHITVDTSPGPIGDVVDEVIRQLELRIAD